MAADEGDFGGRTCVLCQILRAIAGNDDDCDSSMVVACVETGRLDEAQAAAREVLRLRTGFVISDYDGVFGFRNDADTTRFLRAFRAAGMPER